MIRSTISNERFSRQSFLGKDSQKVIERAVVGVAGLGGGGSHIVQQLAHIGFLRYRIYDGDVADDSNLNRLIGAKESDPAHKTPKIEIAERMIKGLRGERRGGVISLPLAGAAGAIASLRPYSWLR